MAVTAQYEKPLQVLETPENRARIKAISDREKISQAEVCRQLIRAALPEREAASADKVYAE